MTRGGDLVSTENDVTNFPSAESVDTHGAEDKRGVRGSMQIFAGEVQLRSLEMGLAGIMCFISNAVTSSTEDCQDLSNSGDCSLPDRI